MKRTVLSLLSVLLLILTLLFAATSCGKETKYTVTFEVNGAEYPIPFASGAVPSFIGSTEKAADENYTYTFVGWDKEIVPATEDTRYTAVYRADPIPRSDVTVTFVVDGVSYPQTVPYGQTPVFAGSTEKEQTEQFVYTFDGWDVTPVPATADATYTARFAVSDRTYNVTFVVDGVTAATGKTAYGQLPVFPAGASLPTKTGFKTIAWIGSLTPVTGDTVLTGVFCNGDPSALTLALGEDPLRYEGTKNDNGGNALTSGSALLLLLEEEYASPANGTFRDAALVHIRSLISGGAEPYFDCEPYWNYPVVTAALAVAKKTPSVWDQLTPAEKEKVDCLMRSYLYICAFATDDDNDFKTGPRLRGNYGKSWNPNYQLANIMPIVFCTDYFGGAQATNDLIAGFDYDTAIADFTKYGFTRALEGVDDRRIPARRRRNDGARRQRTVEFRRYGVHQRSRARLVGSARSDRGQRRRRTRGRCLHL